jgi:exopolysaccharide biosynthesis protein
MKTIIYDIFWLFIFIIVCALNCFCQQNNIEQYFWNKKIVPGINYSHIKKITENGPLHVHIIKIDLKNGKIKVHPKLANGVIGSLERTSDIALRNNAIAAINGSFFEVRKKLHLPVGFMVIDGQVVNKSILPRTAIGITDNKEIVFGIPRIKGYAINRKNNKSVEIWGINRPRKNNEVIIFTKEYGDRTKTNQFGNEIIVSNDGVVSAITNGNSPIPNDGFVVSLHGWTREFAKKTNISDKIDLVYDAADEWKNVKQAITGGPLLVKDGAPVHKESLVNENFKNDMLPPNSRTAIGVTKDNELIFAVVDRRYKLSKGVTYDELAEIMKQAGAENAIGLDGGHTSTMYLNGNVVNFPLYGREAEVSNAIIVTYDGWKLAVAPKVVRALYVYRPPSNELIEALRKSADLTPSSYIPRPEDYGLWGLYDIYNRVIKPVIPDIVITQQTSLKP